MTENNQLNTVKKSTPSRIDKTNKIIDDEVAKTLTDLDVFASDLDAIIEVLKDRFIQSTDASFPIALARVAEVRMDSVKKRIDILKTLVNDKSIETNAKKKSNSLDSLDNILSGIGLGTALGVQVTTANSLNQKKLQEAKVVEQVPFETVYEDDVTIEFDTEHFNISNSLKSSSIDNIINGV